MNKSNQNHNHNQKNQNPNQRKKKHNPVAKATPNPHNISRKFRDIRQRIKRAVPEETAGGVVFRRVQSGVEILMIQDAKDRWTIPKGHIEEGEKQEETAHREVKEETGLKNLKVLDRLGKIEFRYRKQDKLILMTTYVFLMHATGDTDNYTPEQNEGIKDVAWFPVSEALDLIEYDDIGKLFLIALKKIRDGKY